MASSVQTWYPSARCYENIDGWYMILRQNHHLINLENGGENESYVVEHTAYFLITRISLGLSMVVMQLRRAHG